MNKEQLIQKKQELEKQISEFKFPLTYSQTIKRDNLIKELNKINFELKVL